MCGQLIDFDFGKEQLNDLVHIFVAEGGKHTGNLQFLEPGNEVPVTAYDHIDLSFFP